MTTSMRPKFAWTFRCLVSCVIGFVPFITGCSGSQPGSGAGLRVMTFNIHHAEGTDGSVDVDRIAEVILQSGADLVALQEVDRGVERTGKMDILTELSDRTGFAYAFGKTMTFQGGEYGNGILTRFPILEERAILLDTSGALEQRGLMRLLIDVRGQEIIFLNTHLDHARDETPRLHAAARILNEAAAGSASTVILCGDFNAKPGDRPIEVLRTELRDAWEEAGTGPGYTYPSASPERRIDFVFLRNSRGSREPVPREGLRILRASTVCTAASDHCAVLVEFRATPPL